MTQLLLDLPVGVAFDDGDFLVAQANTHAMAWIDRWPNWPQQRLALVGPAGSGKSHLAAIWARRAGAATVAGRDLAAPVDGHLVIEGADAAAERPLLHTLNVAAETGRSVLLVARTAPARWPIALPDLASRLATVVVAMLEAPDEALLSAVLVKHAADRQLAVPPAVIRYLEPRIERSFAAAATVIAALDHAAVARRRRVSLALAREVLAGLAADRHYSVTDPSHRK
jgi:chromosomal replication initiation ATPase DnaA